MELIKACKEGDLKKIKTFLETKNDLDTSLVCLCKYGYYDFVLNLIEKGANLNYQNGKCLVNSCQGGYFEIVKLLVKKGCRITEEALVNVIENSLNGNNKILNFFLDTKLSDSMLEKGFNTACQIGNLDIVKLMKETFQGLIYATENGHFNIVKYLLEKSEKQLDLIVLLHKACRNGHFQIVQYLVEKGANIHKKNQALILATYKGGLNIVNYLIEKYIENSQYNESLLVACDNGFEQLAKVLIQNGADVQYDDNICLLKACSNGNLHISKMLVENGANVRSRNSYHFILACGNGNLQLVKYLVNKGSFIDTFDNQAFLDACYNGHIEVVKYLVEEKGIDVGVRDNQGLIQGFRNNDVRDYLIEKGLDIKKCGKENLNRACLTGNFDLVKFLIHSGVGLTEEGFINACYQGHLKIVDFLLKQGANIEMQNNKAIFLANQILRNKHSEDKVKKEYENVVGFLEKNGACLKRCKGY